MDNAGRYSLFSALGLITAAVFLIGGGGLFAVVTPSYAQASSTTERYSTYFESGGLPLCGGEEVTFSGFVNYVVHTPTLPSGEVQYSITHANFQNVKAVGLTSGKTYPMAEADNSVVRITQVSDDEFLVTSAFLGIHGALPIEGTKTLAQIVLRSTFDENGEATVTVDHVDIKPPYALTLWMANHQIPQRYLVY
jgi:hypothetical protein